MTFGHHKRRDRRDCKHCHEVKDWIFLKYSGPNRIYADALGRPWSGSHCPECVMRKDQQRPRKEPQGRTGDL